ncbi:DUF7837 family putative zinc-binding protein [Halosimplex salinum]|nr:hypothetical protein [Halosimplex salinum]
MHQSPDQLGSCTECGASVFEVDVLVTYETDDGRQYYAECPDCRAVVHPE